MSITGINIDFGYPEYDDMPPSEKNSDELVLFILENASGNRNYIGGYNDDEMHKCARQLLKSGYLRGTIQNEYKCSWSRLTRKGYYLMLLLRDNIDILN